MLPYSCTCENDLHLSFSPRFLCSFIWDDTGNSGNGFREIDIEIVSVLRVERSVRPLMYVACTPVACSRCPPRRVGAYLTRFPLVHLSP
jgi:hypothetical protein